MAKSILDIIIRTVKQGGGDKETVKGLVQLKTSIGTAVTTFAALAGIAYTVDKVLDATVGTYVEYGQKVRDASLALGLSADETSRVIALTDDLGISYEDLSAAIKKNADNTNFSIEGLAAASAEYLALGDAQERAKYAQANYGKQWVEFSKLLEKGPDQVRAMAAAVDEGHLFDEQDLQRIEDYRVAQDQLSDSWEAAKMEVGEALIPALTGLLDNVNAVNEADRRLHEQGIVPNTRAWYEQRAALVESIKAEQDQQDALDESNRATQNAADLAASLAVNYDSLLKSIEGMQSETDRYQETQDEANAAIEQANADFAAGNISAEERDQALEENRKKLDENAEAHKRWAAETVFAFAQAKAAADGNITEGEGQILVDMGVQLGLFDQQTADTMESVNQAFDDVDTENAQEVIDALREQLIELTGQPWNITITTNGSAPAGSSQRVGGPQYATGGAFDAGVPMQVHQDEIMVPDYGGVVLTRTDAMRLLAGTTQNGNGGGKRVTIYGGLTVIAQGSVMDVLDELS
jgi:hypothetical protein